MRTFETRTSGFTPGDIVCWLKLYRPYSSDKEAQRKIRGYIAYAVSASLDGIDDWRECLRSYRSDPHHSVVYALAVRTRALMLVAALYRFVRKVTKRTR